VHGDEKGKGEREFGEVFREGRKSSEVPLII